MHYPGKLNSLIPVTDTQNDKSVKNSHRLNCNHEKQSIEQQVNVRNMISKTKSK